MIYLDYAASTPVDKKVLDLYYDTVLKYYANPNSSHKLGIEARNLIDDSTNNIASILGVLPCEIIYTSGASESNNLVIKGICERYKNRGKHILISALEHNSIVSASTYFQERGFEVELIPVNKDGLIDITALKSLLRDDTILVSVCYVDSEIGLKQPIEAIGEILKEYPNCVFHTDASQAVGKISTNFNYVDLVTITPHKFYGLNGIGIVIKKKDISLTSQINGGKSLTIYRSGTPDTASIVSLKLALEIAVENLSNRYDYIKELSETLKQELKKYKNVHINNTDASIPHTINFSVKGIKSIDLQKRLEDYNIYVSTKTSCCPIETPSKLVYALTKDKILSSTSIRVSLSHLTTKEEINEFLRVFDIIYKEYEDCGKV